MNIQGIASGKVIFLEISNWTLAAASHMLITSHL